MSDQNSHSSENSTGLDDSQTSSGQAAAAPANETQKLQEELAKFKNEYLYLRAEFDNYKRHAIKERADFLKYGSERLARDLLGVLDNFERALATKLTSETLAQFSKGIEMTAQELKNTLQKHGIQEMPCEGAPFDPNFHEALTSEPTTTVPEGHVLRVFQKAYKFHEKILRPAHVVVAKKPDIN